VTDDHLLAQTPEPSVPAGNEGTASQSLDPAESPVEGGLSPRAGLAWQFPVIAASLLAIGAAVVFRRPAPVPPDLDRALADADALLIRGELDASAARLVVVEQGLATRSDLLGPYHLVVADHRAAALEPVLTAPPSQASQVVEAYLRAREDGAILDVPRRRRLAEAMVAAELHADALRILTDIESEVAPIEREEIRALRHRLLRRNVDRRLAAGEPIEAVTEDIQRLLLEDTALDVDAWSTAIDARIRLETGRTEGLAHWLGLAMHRLEGRSAEEPWTRIDWPQLWVLLGHAYRDELGATDRAAECYRVALDRLRAIGMTAAEASLSLGDLEAEAARAAWPGPESADAGDGTSPVLLMMSEAATRYDAVIGMSDASVDQKVAARIGLIDLTLLRGDHAGAIAGFDAVGGLLGQSSLVSERVREAAVRAAMRGAESAMSAAAALESSPGDAAAEVVPLLDAAAAHAAFVHRFAASAAISHRGLEFLASARERAAATLIEPVLGNDDPRVDRAISLMPVEIRLESARRFAAAAEALDLIEADLSGDDPERFDVLWRAAVLHDKAGSVQAALDRYTRFVESQSTEAAMWPEAAYRVAAGHHARHDLAAAATWYRRLLVTMGDGRDEVSEFTTRARVGLARVLMGEGSEIAIGEAESLLNEVLDGTARDAVEPSVPEYRDALLHLARLLAQAGRWNELASRGEEWLSRYPSDPRWGEMAIRTGEGLLRHADGLVVIDSDADVVNPSLVAAREDERRRALSLATGRLQAGVAELDRLGGDGLDPLEAGLLRTGFLLRAMVADRLGDTEASVRLYRETEQRFAGEPVAIVALISMADTAARAGDRETAARATARARKRLEHLHRDGGPAGLQFDPLGPELLLGPGRETIDRWITAFPPGVEEEIG
jgi:tetratricopeptide (TPR) repeat protein